MLRRFKVCGVGFSGISYDFATTCIGNLYNAISFGYGDCRVVDERGGTIRHLVKRESVFVVFGKVECVARECRSKGSSDDVCERAFCSSRKSLFDEVEDAVAVAGKDNLIVVDPVHVTFVKAFG